MGSTRPSRLSPLRGSRPRRLETTAVRRQAPAGTSWASTFRATRREEASPTSFPPSVSRAISAGCASRRTWRGRQPVRHAEHPGLRPDRLGHALLLSADDLAALREAPIPIELCPTSNKMTLHISRCGSTRRWRSSYDRITRPISTDDSSVFGTTPSNELRLCAEACGPTRRSRSPPPLSATPLDETVCLIRQPRGAPSRLCARERTGDAQPRAVVTCSVSLAFASRTNLNECLAPKRDAPAAAARPRRLRRAGAAAWTTSRQEGDSC